MAPKGALAAAAMGAAAGGGRGRAGRRGRGGAGGRGGDGGRGGGGHGGRRQGSGRGSAQRPAWLSNRYANWMVSSFDMTPGAISPLDSWIGSGDIHYRLRGGRGLRQQQQRPAMMQLA